MRFYRILHEGNKLFGPLGSFQKQHLPLHLWSLKWAPSFSMVIFTWSEITNAIVKMDSEPTFTIESATVVNTYLNTRHTMETNNGDFPLINELTLLETCIPEQFGSIISYHSLYWSCVWLYWSHFHTNQHLQCMNKFRSAFLAARTWNMEPLQSESYSFHEHYILSFSVSSHYCVM